MTPTLQLTPNAAARLYDGPRFHRSLTPAQQRQVIRGVIRQYKASPHAVLRYMGCVLDAIMKFKQQRR